MRKLLHCLLALSLSSLAVPAASGGSRTFRFTYEAHVGPVPAGEGPVHVWVPLAESDEHQVVHERTIRASIEGTLGRDRTQGNLFWHGVAPSSDGKPIEVVVTYLVERKAYRTGHLDRPVGRRLSERERRRYRAFLEPDALVPVDAPMLAPILEDVRRRAGSQDPARVARAIYDWIVENMEYKKVGTGWGKGDTAFACSQRYGNCTDFHSLFMSMARSEDLPARFEIGFPVPTSAPSGTIGGYHCWTQFYLPGRGWIPVDASEAAKHPERKEEFYGGQPADRIRFTTGRDLDLGPGHGSGPLNYFIHPHVEVAGRAWEGEVQERFAFEDVPGISRTSAAGQ